MNGILQKWGFSGTSVTVTNGIANDNWNADGHIVGPASTSAGCVSSGDANGWGYGNGVCPLALWDSDGGVAHLNSRDTILTNLGGTSAGNDRITMSLAGLNQGGQSVTGISFDLEIFPDGDCPDGGSGTCINTGSASWPDLNLWVNGVNLPAWNWFGVEPNTKSPLLVNETAPQLLTTSGLISVSGPTLNLDFVDWPAKIGIDNLKIYWTNTGGGGQNVPEPGTLGLLGVGLAGFWSMRRKGRA